MLRLYSFIYLQFVYGRWERLRLYDIERWGGYRKMNWNKKSGKRLFQPTACFYRGVSFSDRGNLRESYVRIAGDGSEPRFEYETSRVQSGSSAHATDNSDDWRGNNRSEGTVSKTYVNFHGMKYRSQNRLRKWLWWRHAGTCTNRTWS